MVEIFFVAIVFLPYVAIGKIIKTGKDYCKKKNWIFIGEILYVVGLPFSLYDDVCY
jgi:hypothetical protein